MKRTWTKRTLLSVGVILAVLFFMLTVIGGIARFQLLSPSFYQTAVRRQSAEIYQNVMKEVSVQCAQYDLPEHLMDTAVTEQTVTESAERYIGDYFTALIDGKDPSQIDAVFSDQPIAEALEAYVASDKVITKYQSEKNRKVLTENFGALVRGTIAALSQPVVSSLTGHLAKPLRLLSLLADLFYPFAVLFLLLAAGGYLYAFRWGSRRFCYFGSLVMLFVTEIWTIPLWMITLFDVPKHSVLSDGVLYRYFSSIWNALFRTDAVCCTVMTAAALILFLFSVFYKQHTNK